MEKRMVKDYAGYTQYKLIEVYPGIDVQKDILDLLSFEVEV